MQTNWVQSETVDEVTQLRLARPEKRNALTRSMIDDAVEHLERIIREAKTRVLVLSAEGAVFCAGMDLGEMQERAASPSAAAEWLEDSRVYRKLVGMLYRAPFPTIAVVQGAAVAGGMGLVLACDLVVSSEQAFFALPEPMRGITAAIVAPLLQWRVGSGAAQTLLLSGERCDAARSLRIGLSYDVVPAEQLEQRVSTLTNKVLTGAPAALQITKQHMLNCFGAEMDELLDRSIEVSAQARESDDAREGLAAFLEKRKTRWQPE